jgi:hypothetical protein
MGRADKKIQRWLESFLFGTCPKRHLNFSAAADILSHFVQFIDTAAPAR